MSGTRASVCGGVLPVRGHPPDTCSPTLTVRAAWPADTSPLGQPNHARALAAAALDLADRQARVLPLAPGGKVPLTPHGCRDATSDAATIRRWWQRWPSANIGLATGGGLLVLDVDPRHGGDASLAELPELPPTRESLTGGGGRHLFYRGEARCSAGRLGSGLDVRGAGGYIVAPPSVHPSGGLYRWHPSRGLAHPVAALRLRRLVA